MEFPTILDPVLRHLIITTKEYIEEVRHTHVEFHLSMDDWGIVTARFDYGREAKGSLTQAICRAIGNALEPLSHQDRKALRG